MGVNSGYVGWSMSRRAAEAYEDGEMPKSKWTKKAMVAAIQSYCDEFDMLFDPDLLKGMHKDEVFERFFYESSWHHTSKFFNETDFYKLDEDAVCGSFRPMNPTEVAERDAVRRQAIEEEKAVREAMRAAEIEQLDRHRAYREEHGFAPDTVAAFAHEHPECCQERVSRKGNRVLSYIDYLGHEQVCPIEHIRDSHLHGFDATEPGSFDRAIECHQLHNARNAGNDPITVKGEATAMKAASAEMADGAGKHDIGQMGSRDTIKPSLATSAQKGKVTTMPEKTAQQDDRRSGFAHVKIPAAFVHPYTYTAKDGREFEKAYVDIPKGTKVNGIDIGGYSCDVFMNDRMKQQMLSGEQPTLSFKGDVPVAIWTGRMGDPEHPYQRFEVNPWALVKGMKANNEEFKATKAAERAAEQEQGVSLKGEAEASREAADALSGHEAKDGLAQDR